MPSGQDSIRWRTPAEVCWIIRRNSPRTSALPRLAASVLEPDPHPVAGGHPRLDVGHLHARRARDEVLHHQQQVVAQPVVLADLDRGQLHALVVAGVGLGHLAARLAASGLRLMRAGDHPPDQLVAAEHRHDRELVRVVDSPVQRLVAVVDVTLADPDRRIVGEPRRG